MTEKQPSRDELASYAQHVALRRHLEEQFNALFLHETAKHGPEAMLPMVEALCSTLMSAYVTLAGNVSLDILRDLRRTLIDVRREHLNRVMSSDDPVAAAQACMDVKLEVRPIRIVEAPHVPLRES